LISIQKFYLVTALTAPMYSIDVLTVSSVGNEEIKLFS